MAQPEKSSSFLNKLARFVANPTTDWSALDSTLTGDREGIPEETDLAALSPAEILARRHQRRKHNRNIRIKEFAILRQVRAGASLPGITPVPSSNPSGGAGVLPQKPAALPQQSTRIADFNVNQIDHIEKQMAEQWWDKPGADALPPEPAAAVEQIPKTQMLIETQIAKFSPHSAAQEGDVIAFDPALFESPAAPAASAPVPPAAGPEVPPSSASTIPDDSVSTQ